jgi:hypothetical protein
MLFHILLNLYLSPRCRPQILLLMSTNPEQAIDALRKISDAEFDRIFDSPWHRFPAELVRNELIRRLKNRRDLSLDAKKVAYKQVIDRYYTIRNMAILESFWQEISEVNKDVMRISRSMLESSQNNIEWMNEHARQLRDIHSRRNNSFEGKSKPGDWRPDGTEVCPACDGDGKGAAGRMCAKCSGRGFIRR